MLEDFPNARFIFTYRDPRDNYVSFKKKLGEEINAVGFSKSWNQAWENSSKIENERILFIKYENLVQQPEKEMNTVADFLGIEYQNVLIQPSKMGISWKGNSMFGAKSENISTKSFGRYKEIISKQDLMILESFCFKKMKKSGYNLDISLEKLDDIKSMCQLEYDEWTPFGYADKKNLRQQLGKLRIALTGRSHKAK
jgi:hypothetical protein